MMAFILGIAVGCVVVKPDEHVKPATIYTGWDQWEAGFQKGFECGVKMSENKKGELE